MVCDLQVQITTYIMAPFKIIPPPSITDLTLNFYHLVSLCWCEVNTELTLTVCFPLSGVV